MFRLGSLGFCGAGWTRPSGVRKNFSFSPKDMYIRPDRLSGICNVRPAPLVGPGIEASGAGLGGNEPAGHGVKVPAALTYPSRPVVRFTPRRYRYTGPLRPELFVTFIGSRFSAASARVSGIVARTANTPIAAASQILSLGRTGTSLDDPRIDRRATATRRRALS